MDAVTIHLTLISVHAVMSVLSGPPDNEGKKFILAFGDNYPINSSLNDEIYITTSKQHPVQVSVSSPRFLNCLLNEHFNVTAGDVHIVSVPANLTVVGPGLSSKGIYITADDDISVYAVNLELHSTDAFLCLPLDVIGQNYYALTYTVAVKKSDFSQILIVGVQNETKILLQIPEGVSSYFYPKNIAVNKKTVRCTINSFDTFQIQSKYDLTGTNIKSSKPIVVFSGNRKTHVGFKKGARDHICQQLTPVDTWGREFIVVPIPERKVGDILRIMTSEHNTTVTTKSDINTTETHLTCPGSFYEMETKSDEYINIQSNKPIIVAQYIKTGRRNDSSDPSLIVVPAVHQFAAMYTFSTPKDPHGKTIKHFFMFVTKTDQLRSLRINGSLLKGEIVQNVSDSNYTGGYIMLQEGTYRITQSSPVYLFSGILYGRAKIQSYALPIGLRLPRTNVCNKTISVDGSGIENDCDGLIDEEIFTNHDSDMSRSCRCPCGKVGRKWNHLLDLNLSKEQLQHALREERERLRIEIRIDKKKTSKYIYTKKSNSQDKRTMSKGLSLGFIFFTSIPVILIVLSDLHNLYYCLRNR